ncbi:MAG: RHS repeat-associated core domain-containing protein, partial [Terriglobales bacterium]
AYNPTLGRFMTEDPKVFDAGDYNLFRYCHNDPIDFTDPMGLAADGQYVEPPVSYSQWSQQQDTPRSVIGFSPMEGDAARANNYQRALQMAQESYTPSRLPHGNDPWAMTREGARAAAAAEQAAQDKREYHTYTFQNPKKDNDFVRTPVRPGAREGTSNTTTVMLKYKGALYPPAAVGGYKYWGVGMNEVRYDPAMIKADLARLRFFHVNGVIMTPLPPSGSAIISNPPYFYDAGRDSTYAP